MHILEDDNLATLILDSKHPGIKDTHYISRRTEFFNAARRCRLTQSEISLIEYQEEEHAIWRHIYENLTQIHHEKACSIYLEGKKALSLDPAHLPQLKTLSQQLQDSHQVRLVPAEGLLKPRTFFAYLSQRIMPCTQFLRHGADPEYTPEPDIVHDVLGHVPPLMNAEYAELMQMLGQGVRMADEKQMLAWERIYWFAIEFGLIVENDDLKVFGAGLLSSYGEMDFCFSNKVTHKLFNIEEVIDTDYDSTKMQPLLFYIPSFDFLKKEIIKLMKMLQEDVKRDDDVQGGGR